MATTAQARGRSAKDIPAPAHYNQATRSPDWPLWKMSIDAELEQLGVRKAFTVQPERMVGDNLLITTTWVFTVKDDVDPASGALLLKSKARLTARGDLVDPSRIHPDQLNAPTIDPEMVPQLSVHPIAHRGYVLECPPQRSRPADFPPRTAGHGRRPSWTRPAAEHQPIRFVRGGVTLVLRPLVHADATRLGQAPDRELPVAPPGRPGHAR